MSLNCYQQLLKRTNYSFPVIWMILSIHMLLIYWLYFPRNIFVTSPAMLNKHAISLVNTTSTALSTVATFRKPPFPSLVIIGPPKCGTTTLVTSMGNMSDFIQHPLYHGENHWWNGWDGEPKCFPKWSYTKWAQLFEDWRSDPLFSFTNTLNAEIISIGAQCHVQNYLQNIELQCLNNNMSHCNNGKSYFVEAAQSYHRNPFIAIPYGLYMKETKLIQSIRDPINMVWSFTWHFYKLFFPEQSYRTNAERLQAMESFVIDRFTKSYPDGYADDFSELSSYCSKIRNDMSNMQHRKEMMIAYLKIKFIRKVAEPKLRQDGFVWIANYLSGFLFYLHILDEIYGDTQWDQFRVIQFEWFYASKANTGNGLQQIRKWVVDPERYPSVVESDFDLAQYTDASTEEKVSRNMHMSNGTYSAQFRNKLMPLLSDCNHVLQDIIFHERPWMLIGDWIDWGY